MADWTGNTHSAFSCNGASNHSTGERRERMTDKVHEELTPDICKTCTKDETKCGTCPATIA